MTNVDWITYHNRMYKAMTGDKETFVTRIYPQAETAGNIKSMTINVGSRSAIYMNIADVKKPMRMLMHLNLRAAYMYM